MTSATQHSLNTHLAEFPDVLAELGLAHDAAWSTVNPEILELCRLRIAQLLGATSELAHRTPEAALHNDKYNSVAQWPTSSLFSEAEQACLSFTEEFVIDVANLGHATAVNVGELIGQQEFADFVSALLVIEQRIRISLAWQNLFGEAQ